VADGISLKSIEISAGFVSFGMPLDLSKFGIITAHSWQAGLDGLGEGPTV